MSETKQEIELDRSDRPPVQPPEREATPDAHGLVGVPKEQDQGNWFHRNRWFTKEPITYTGYQFVRAFFATLPYGPLMALGHHAFGMMSAKGQKMGLTQEGINTFTNKGGLAAVEKAALENRDAIFKTGKNAVFGRNMMRLGNSPLNAAFQIAMGFTLFRFTGGLVKNLRDRVMNEKNSPEDTDRETRNAFATIKETAKTNWPAESTGTPIAALVLGFMNAAFTPAMFLTRDKAKYPGFKGYTQQVKQAWTAPNAKLLQNAAVWTLSYSLFFLMAESLFKDVQIRRGLWKGHPNSLKNGPDDTVGGPGAPDYKTPENDTAIRESAEEGYKKVDDKAQDSQAKLRHPMLTGEPSWGRFMFRRVLPVCVGISSYAALKRAGYLGFGGQMAPLTVQTVDNLKTVGDHVKLWGKNSYKEGGATIMFGALWWATDAGGSWYDKLVHKMQHPDHKVELNEHQQRKHTELHEQLRAKETGHLRSA